MGAQTVSGEMVIFELMHQAGSEQFKIISKQFLISEQRKYKAGEQAFQLVCYPSCNSKYNSVKRL